MRILIIHTSYKVRGGEDSVVNNERDLLRSAGHEVNLLLFSNSRRTLLKLARFPFNYSSYIAAKKEIQAFKPDIVHVHNLHFAGSVSVIYAAKKSRVPVVATLHNYRLLCPSGTLFFRGRLFTASMRRVFPWQAVREGVYQDSALLTFWFALCAAVQYFLQSWTIPVQFIVLGETQKELFLNSKYRLLVSKMIVKPNFCHPPSAGKRSAGKYYLYVGRLGPEKGIGMMLNTFSRSGLQLKIAGSGVMEEKVLAYAAVHANIEYLGAKNKSEIDLLMAGAAALIFPSIWYETFGLVIIEAFACGTPVIAAAIGEPKHLVQDRVNGLLFEPGSENDLAEKLNYFEALSADQKEAFAKAAKTTYLSNYSPSKNISQLEGIYRAALAQ